MASMVRIGVSGWICAVLLSGCAGAGAGADGGAPDAASVDAGGLDAGTALDAGPSRDGGNVDDAGVTGDAGRHVDAGDGEDAGRLADAGNPVDAGSPVDAGGEPSRPYRLAASGIQVLVSGPAIGFQMTDANLATDVDVNAVHQEYYGVPWAELEAGAAPPSEWTATLTAVAHSMATSGKPVFLSISPIDGARRSLAARTVVRDGSPQGEPGWAAACYDFRTAPDAAQKRAAFIRYVELMVDLFQPTWLNVAIELNLFFEQCPAAVAGMIDVVNAAYDAAKARRAGTIVFPSFAVEHLYGVSPDSCPSGDTGACFDTHYAQIAPLRRDRFAMSTYPYLAGVTRVADLPADWFTRGAARAHERPLVAETGWLSSAIVARRADSSCATVGTWNETDERAYLDRLLRDADAAGMDLVTWAFDRDIVTTEAMTDCPCDFDATWCAVIDAFRGPVVAGDPDAQYRGEVLLKVFGQTGLRRYDGTPKSLVLGRWNEARALPLRAP